MILIVLLYFLFALTFTLGKSLLAVLPPILLIGIRMTIGGFLILIGYIYTYGMPTIRWCDWRRFGIIAFFHIYLAYTTEFWALQYVTAAKTALAYNLSPFITALLARLFLHERLSSPKIIGLMIGILGMLPVLLTVTPAEGITQTHLLSFPEIMLLVSVASSAMGWILIKEHTKPGSYSFLLINAVSMIIGGLAALITSVCMEEYSFVIAITAHTWFKLGIELGLLILVANIICYNLYGYLLGKYSATLLSFAGFLTPVFAALLSWVFLGEVVELAFWYSWVFLCIGSGIFYIEDKKRLPSE